MKPEQQRIAIALADGIVNINSKCWRGHRDGYEVRIPDYLNDLNAMHEAEKVGEKLFKSKREREEYWNDLEQWLHALTDERGAFATAPQRAEAFLRTLNLWEESL